MNDQPEKPTTPAGTPSAESKLPGWLEPPPEPALFERVIKMRIALSIGLAIPLGFLIFLVGWAGESWLVAAAGIGVYLYILAQFFIFQNPRRNARVASELRRRADTDPP